MTDFPKGPEVELYAEATSEDGGTQIASRHDEIVEYSVLVKQHSGDGDYEIIYDEEFPSYEKAHAAAVVQCIRHGLEITDIDEIGG